MEKQKSKIAGRILFMLILSIGVLAGSAMSVMAAEKQNVEEGTYYIKAINGNGNGKVLYWDEKAKDQNTCMMFESCGGSHADNEVWFITKNRNFDDYYGIYLYKDYRPQIQNWKDKCKRIEIDNLTGRDQPYLLSTKGPHVFCGPFSNQDDAFVFMNEKGDGSYTNLSIWSRADQYRFNRHKETKLFHHDLIYVNANKDKDTKNKLWELIPVNYVRKLSATAPAVKASDNGTAKVKWNKLRSKFKNSKVWKNAKMIEIQYSTDKEFLKNVKTKKIKKGTFNKKNAKAKLSKLKIKKTYYVRARLVDKKGVGSNWSKAVKIKTKK